MQAQIAQFSDTIEKCGFLTELAKVPNLFFGVHWALPVKHLVVCSRPLVGDPLITNQDRTASVDHPSVMASTLVHIPPDHHRPLARPDKGTYQRKHGVAANLDVAQIPHDLQMNMKHQ